MWIKSDGLCLPSLSKRKLAQCFLSLSAAAAWCQSLLMSQHLRLALSSFSMLTPLLVVTCFACTASSQTASLRWSLPWLDLLLCYKTLPKAEAFVGLYAPSEGTAWEEARLYHSGWKELVRYDLCLRPHAYVQIQAKFAGPKHLVFSLPWIPARRERQHRQKNLL